MRKFALLRATSFRRKASLSGFRNAMKKQNTVFTFAFLFSLVRLILISCSSDILPPDNLIFWFPLYLCALGALWLNSINQK